MTREQLIQRYQSLTPRERDAWVERAVFGGGTYGNFREVNGVRVLIPHYTTDLSAAWTVLEQFPYIEVARLPYGGTTYGVRINGTDGDIRAMTEETTFPDAVCLAALIAKMKEA